MAGMGTGYPIFFECFKARSIYYGNRSSKGEEVTRTRIERDGHKVELTGRARSAPSPGRGHPRKSRLSREYKCSCGHIGWSCHADLERLAKKLGLP